MRERLGLADEAVCRQMPSPFIREQLAVQLANDIDTRYQARQRSLGQLVATLADVAAGRGDPLWIPNVDDAYDLPQLSEYLVAIKNEYPQKEDASVLLEPQIPYDYLIQVMDIVRAVEVPTGNEDEVELYALFSEISVGDAP